MKKYLVVAGFLLISGMVYAQKRNDFKGPGAKNYKPWKYAVPATPVSVIGDRETLEIGPRSKNAIPSIKIAEIEVVEISDILNNRRLGMVGPKAKNYKIGRGRND